ncbi:MAG: tetratricopeptide repeat protein [Rhodothermales bacterium]|nr:tetratricopeptide repeat protein [Rhodothermales bacterium]
MKRFSILIAVFVGFVLMGADGCSSDPNVEGAKLDLRNKDYDRALENVNTALENDPENPVAHALKGDILLEMAFTVEDVDEHTTMINDMVESYSKAASLGQELGNAMQVAYAQEFQRGVQAFNRGSNDIDQYSDSYQYFMNAATIAPDSTGPYVNGGYALMNAGRTEDAAMPFEKAVEMGDTDPQTYVYLASIYQMKENYADAVAILEKAEGVDPGNIEVQTQLLNAYQMAGMFDRAMTKYKQKIQEEPDNKLYQYNYGSLLLENEDYDNAIIHLSKAVELDPDYANANYNLGAAYQNKAVGYAEQVNEMDDELRANRSDMSSAEIKTAEDEINALIELKKENFSMAIGPLERAKELTEMNDGDPAGICVALYAAYVQTNQLESAQSIASCAGYDEE